MENVEFYLEVGFPARVLLAKGGGQGVYTGIIPLWLTRLYTTKGGDIIQGSILPRITTFNFTLGIALG